ncbi:hypothetical protein BSFA1_77470 (plasmid) [Burkholderia sp. SFA1]|nr:hypothetical protein BSFA1_77470 [Burkholderia sp. SFA1]
MPDQINLIVPIVAQEEVDPHFGVYELMHTACRRAPYDRLSSLRSFIHAPCTPSRLWRPY